MYKKLLAVFCILFITLPLTGCSDLKFIFQKDKPSINFHTENLTNSYIENPPTEVSVFDINMYKEKKLNDEECFDILKFINSLKKDYAIEENNIDLNENEMAYKVFITFDNIKYVINVYNEKYISVYPWDGTHKKDYIDMSKIPLSYNLYGLCKHFTDNSSSKDNTNETDNSTENQLKNEKEGN